MDTIIRKVDCDNIDNDVIKEAADILRAGGLVAFPTETVYGLGGNALDPKASEKIYAAKGRPSDNPLIVHISKVEDLYELASEVPESALLLAKRFWPGPLTMILNKKEIVPDTITGGLSSVAIRMPNHKVALELIDKSGVYVAAPSANTSGRPSPTSAAHVAEDLSGKIDMIIDGGDGDIGIESTIVDLTENIPTILRPGYITLSDIKECLGQAQIDKGLKKNNENAVPKAPGMKYRHYAPQGELTVVTGDNDKVVERINELVRIALSQGKKVAVMGTEGNLSSYKCEIVRNLGAYGDAKEASHRLYGYLREFDDLGVDVMFSEGYSEQDVGQALMNRMLKAAGQHIEQVGE